MNKKEILIPFIFIGLSAAFLLISAMVYFSGGKSKKWIARKMRIGGILLTLTSISCNSGRQVKCYDAEPFNYMSIINSSEKGIEINLDSNNILLGRISGREGINFSFSITDKSGNIKQKDIVLPVDIAFDSNYEDFKIQIDKKLAEGNYQLKLYAAAPKNQDSIKPQDELILKIKHE